jgi:hypothetical protein
LSLIQPFVCCYRLARADFFFAEDFFAVFAGRDLELDFFFAAGFLLELAFFAPLREAFFAGLRAACFFFAAGFFAGAFFAEAFFAGFFIAFLAGFFAGATFFADLAAGGADAGSSIAVSSTSKMRTPSTTISGAPRGRVAARSCFSRFAAVEPLGRPRRPRGAPPPKRSSSSSSSSASSPSAATVSSSSSSSTSSALSQSRSL